jgi:hypothetical protein
VNDYANQCKFYIVGEHLMLTLKVSGQSAIVEPWGDECWEGTKSIRNSQERNDIFVLKFQP